jgi:3-phosphoshikimate 1-carboxyvinyltransferase
MKVLIHGGHQAAVIALPASKSLSHRALIAASLSKGDVLIHHPAHNRDTEATMQVLSHLGASFEAEGEDVLVHGMGYPRYDGALLDCGESGSTLRFLIPLATLGSDPVRFTGHGRLMERPQSVYEQLYHHRHLRFEKKDDILTVQGPITGGKYKVDGSVSSQFISGLLFALPLCHEESTLCVTEPYESKSYVGLTLDMLKRSGIRIDETGNTYHIPADQIYDLKETAVAGDDSQMAFFAAKGVLGSAPVEVIHVDHDSRQGDHIILAYLEKMGGRIETTAGGYRFYPSHLHGETMDLGDCPDLGPMLFGLAALAEGTSHFVHAGRLRIKESDRIACMEEELNKLGCHMISDEDTVTIEGVEKLKENVSLHGHNDHRIVMALSILASCSDGIIIDEAEAVNKSYPDFFKDLQRCGAEVSYDQ